MRSVLVLFCALSLACSSAASSPTDVTLPPAATSSDASRPLATDPAQGLPTFPIPQDTDEIELWFDGPEPHRALIVRRSTNLNTGIAGALIAGEPPPPEEDIAPGSMKVSSGALGKYGARMVRFQKANGLWQFVAIAKVGDSAGTSILLWLTSMRAEDESLFRLVVERFGGALKPGSELSSLRVGGDVIAVPRAFRLAFASLSGRSDERILVYRDEHKRCAAFEEDVRTMAGSRPVEIQRQVVRGHAFAVAHTPVGSFHWSAACHVDGPLQLKAELQCAPDRCSIDFPSLLDTITSLAFDE